MTTLEEERKRIYQEGEARGEARGRTEGRVETQRQTIGQLLQFRFELAEAELSPYVRQVTKIQDLHHLDELINALLNKTTSLEDFANLLNKRL
jgi:predicted transposase YdaD